jgi:ubiquinone/menaquinone biosynthesis C-methylase UbiE
MQRVNYDKIAHLYDEPLRNHTVDTNLLHFLDQRPEIGHASLRTLDVGCGTGKQQTANRSQFADSQLMGLDLFAGMLRQAQKRRPSIDWSQGDGAYLPFAANTFNYVSNQFSYPHMQEKERFIIEVFRVLQFNGRFCMKNIDPWQMPNWHIYQYFPAAQAIDFQDFLPAERFASLMENAGFTNLQIGREQLHLSQPLHEFHTYASQRYRSSQFMAISNEDYAAGLARLTADLEIKPTLNYEVCLITVCGDKQ